MEGNLGEERDELISKVEEGLKQMNESNEAESSTEYLIKFGESILKDLREYCDSCKKKVHRCKGLIVEVEEFYLKVKKSGEMPVAPTIDNSSN